MCCRWSENIDYRIRKNCNDTSFRDDKCIKLSRDKKKKKKNIYSVDASDISQVDSERGTLEFSGVSAERELFSRGNIIRKKKSTWNCWSVPSKFLAEGKSGMGFVSCHRRWATVILFHLYLIQYIFFFYYFLFLIDINRVVFSSTIPFIIIIFFLLSKNFYIFLLISIFNTKFSNLQNDLKT